MLGLKVGVAKKTRRKKVKGILDSGKQAKEGVVRGPGLLIEI